MGNKNSGPKVPLITLNLGAEPVSDEERKIFDKFAAALTKCPDLLNLLLNYSGCEEFIRAALNDPNAETEGAAWKAVQKSVDKLHKFYKWALAMEDDFSRLLVTLCGGDATSKVQANQALVSQLSAIFDFAFHFDEKKMVNPAIQNDFSYYRRVLSRMKSGTAKVKMSKSKDDKNKSKVTEEIANKMSFFFAYPTPMMKVLIDTSFKSDEEIQRDELVAGLSLMANVCLAMLEKDPSLDTKSKMQLLCAMTGCVILVDHLTPQGAFHKKSPIRIKQCIAFVKNFTEQSTDFLLNSLRFTTLHLNDDQTMPEIKKLLT